MHSVYWECDLRKHRVKCWRCWLSSAMLYNAPWIKSRPVLAQHQGGYTLLEKKCFLETKMDLLGPHWRTLLVAGRTFSTQGSTWNPKWFYLELKRFVPGTKKCSPTGSVEKPFFSKSVGEVLSGRYDVPNL